MGQKSKSAKKTKNCKGNPPTRPDKLNTSMNTSMNENTQSPSNSNDLRSTSTSSPISGTADMLGQSRQVLYGQQHIHNMNSMQNTQPPCLPNLVVNNQTPGQPTPVNNTHMLYQYSQPMPLNSGNVNPSSAMNNGIPPWAANMCQQLQNIQGQLEMQNERWQSVENKLADQSARMTNIESQISQFNQVKQTVSENARTIDAINKQMRSLQLKIDDYDNNVLEYSNICDNVITANTELGSKVNDMLYRVSTVEDKVVDVQWRNMRENLIFTGIPESERQYDGYGRIKPEDCKSVIKEFLRSEMFISRDIQFDRVHRLGKFRRDQQYPRPIIAKFTYYKDKEDVRQTAPEVLMGKRFGVREQFPQEIEDTRKLLYPVAKNARRNPDNRVRLVRDKLFINGEQHVPNQSSNQPNYVQNRNNRQVSSRQNTTYIGQSSSHSRFSNPNNRPNTHQQSSAPKQYGNRTDWNFPVRPREKQLRTPVNAHSHNDNFLSNRFGLLSNDDGAREGSISYAGKKKATSPLDADMTLKKQRSNINHDSTENLCIEMTTYSVSGANYVSDDVSTPDNFNVRL